MIQKNRKVIIFGGSRDWSYLLFEMKRWNLSLSLSLSLSLACYLARCFLLLLFLWVFPLSLSLSRSLYHSLSHSMPSLLLFHFVSLSSIFLFSLRRRFFFCGEIDAFRPDSLLFPWTKEFCSRGAQ